MDKQKLNAFFLRLPLAISMFGHGAVRIPKLQTFSGWMVTTMEKSVLSAALVKPFSLILPFIEVVIGIALLVGWQLRPTIYAGLALMAVLILGSSSIENWAAIEAQLLHAAYFALLLWWTDKHHSTAE